MITYISISTILQILPAYFLMLSIFRKRLKVSLFTATGFGLVLTVLFLLASIFLCSPHNSAQGWQIAFSIVTMVMFLGICVGMIRASIYQITFMLFVVRGYLDNLMLISKMLENNFLNIYTNWSYETKALAATTFILIITFPLMLLFTEKLLHPMVETDHMPFWRYLWILPISFYGVYRLGIYPNISKLFDTSEWNSREFVLAFAWSSVTFIFYILVLKMLDETSSASKLQEKLHISKLQILMQQEQYEAFKSNIDEIRRARHDLRHHVLALLGYANRNDAQGAVAYLNTLLNVLEPENIIPTCDNSAVDAVASYYQNVAKRNEIDITISLKLPQELPVEDSDMCVVLGNLMENAIEACERQTEQRKFITVKAGLVGENIIAVTVKNSYSGEIGRAGESFLSSKRKWEGEGIGVNSVRNIAERYSGIAKFEYESGEFKASVMLNKESGGAKSGK